MRLREGDADHPPLTASSAGRTVVAVRGFHKFLLREGLTAVDPAAAVKPPAPPQRLPKALSVDEVTRILAAAAGAEAEPAVLATRDAALLEFLYGTGARISEAVGLDVDEVDLETGDGPAPRQGQQGTRRAGRLLRPRRAVGVPGPRPARPRRAEVAVRRPSSSTRAADACPARAPGPYCDAPPSERESPRRSRRTRCATRSPPTCSTAAPTSAWCRNSSATPPSPPPRSTRWSPSTNSARSTRRRTRGHCPASYCAPVAEETVSAEERHASWLERFLGWFSTYDRLVERARRTEPATV